MLLYSLKTNYNVHNSFSFSHLLFQHILMMTEICVQSSFGDECLQTPALGRWRQYNQEFNTSLLHMTGGGQPVSNRKKEKLQIQLSAVLHACFSTWEVEAKDELFKATPNYMGSSLEASLGYQRPHLTKQNKQKQSHNYNL